MKNQQRKLNHNQMEPQQMHKNDEAKAKMMQNLNVRDNNAIEGK